MFPRTILVIEEERLLSGLLEDYSAKTVNRFAVISCNSIFQALKILKQSSIDLLICSHARSANFDGLELLRRLSGIGYGLRVILQAPEELEKDRIEALRLGCSIFLTRPFSYQGFFDLVASMLTSQQGYSGKLVGMRLEDVIQMLCYRKESTMLSVSLNNKPGTIYVHEGGIVHAEYDSIFGVEAFYEILGMDGGEFVSQVILTVPEQTVFMDWQSLLMEGMRQKDEIRHALGPVATETASSPSEEASRSRPKRDFANQAPKRIMIVDDSRFIRKIVQEILQSDPGIIVAGYAGNGQEALSKIDELKPDLILLDWDMPVMKGSTTLMHIMIRSPCPVVILSGFVGGVGTNPFDLLCLGGVDFLRKPQNNWRLDGRADDLVNRIKEACRIRFDRIRRVKIPSMVKETATAGNEGVPCEHVSVVCSSVGGCIDLIRMIPMLPENMPSAILVVHDMQQEAIGAFIDYLDRRSRIPVRPVESGIPLYSGICYVHPTSVPLEMTTERGQFVLKHSEKLPHSRALDDFLRSAASCSGKNIAAVLLSGSSDACLSGFVAVKKAGGTTMVLDPASSLDPRAIEAALREGIVDYRCQADNLVDSFQKLFR